jgi:hypothetical protein
VSFYCVDEDFGPHFPMICSYNGTLHQRTQVLETQFAKRQRAAFQALDNAIKRCAEPRLLQRLADELTTEKIDLRQW